VSLNGLALELKALNDTGANAFALINHHKALTIAQCLGTKIRLLPSAQPVRGFNGQAGTPIAYYLRLNFEIDKRKMRNVPFLVCELGQHDIILGRQFFQHCGATLNCTNNSLQWPTWFRPFPYPLGEIVLPPEALYEVPLDESQQEDADRRDALLDAEDELHGNSINTLNCGEKAGAGFRLRPASKRGRKHLEHVVRRTFALDRHDNYRKMERNLRGERIPQPASRLAPHSLSFSFDSSSSNTPLDFSFISAAAFRLNTRQPDTEVGFTSLYEIDRLIEDRTDERMRVRKSLSGPKLPLLKLIGPENPQTVEINDVAHPGDDEEDFSVLPKRYHHLKEVFSGLESNKMPPSRPYDHKIELEDGARDKLTYTPLYHMSLEELQITKQYLTEQLERGWIEPSQAPFACPVLFVKKPNGGLRFCIDFRKLNLLTRKDRYPLPLIEETLARLSRARIFTKLDIRQAFHRIRMHPDSEELTTFRTRYGAYKCKVMPFGLTNGPATYQRFMNDVLFDYLDDFCTVYLDDILIYSENKLEHEAQVEKVLLRLKDAGLQADLKKCEFGVRKTKYLGFIVSTDGIQVDPDKVQVVKNWGVPTSVKGVQSFLGFCNFYRRFIRDYGTIAKPLIHLTKKDMPFHFDAECHFAFQTLKELLTHAPLLRHYQFDRETRIETDASDGVVAGVLSQKYVQDDAEVWHPVAYFSKTMSPAEMNYMIHDKELLGIIQSFKHWRAELISSPERIRVYTDHKGLEYFMSKKELNARQMRWAEFLSEFDFVIEYRPGKENAAADALTRRTDELAAQTSEKKASRVHQLLRDEMLDHRILQEMRPEEQGNVVALLEELAPLSEGTSLIDRLLQANRTSSALNALRKAAERGEKDFALEEGLLLYKDRLLVPNEGSLRADLIREAHCQVSTAHPGRDKTRQILAERYYWRGMDADVGQYIKNCYTCQRARAPRDRKPGLLQPLPVPYRPWSCISMDYCSFNKDKHGYDNVFVIIDRLSKQAISIPCHKTIDAQGMARLFIAHIYRYFGPPDDIVSDRGPQFISTFWKEFTRILGITLKYSSGYHPQTDGQTEIYNQYLQQRLRPFVSYYQDDWSELLPMMDYAQISLPHDSLGGLSPGEVIFGYPFRTSFDWTPQKAPSLSSRHNIEAARAAASRMHGAWKTAREQMQTAQQKQKRNADRHRREVNFKEKDMVFVDMRHLSNDRPSRKLDNPLKGPFEIEERVYDSYKLKLPVSMKIHDVFSPDKLRLAARDPLTGQYNPPEEPINITGEDEWEVQEVLAVKRVKTKLYYRVKWTGWDEDLEWYPASDIKYAPHKIRDFHLAHPDRSGPPRSLLAWLKAWEDGEDDYDELDDDAAMDKASRRAFFGGGGGVTVQT
jgi:transposase InsO family protein